MTEAEKILKLIEEVSPDDTAKLDEIDALVHAYMMNLDWQWVRPVGRLFWNKRWTFNAGRGEFQQKPVRYTKSRDALKAIRPEGWTFEVWFDDDLEPYGFFGRLSLDKKLTHVYMRPTEELAELHAIVQAIEYERQTK